MYLETLDIEIDPNLKPALLCEAQKFEAAEKGDLERLKQVHRVHASWEKLFPDPDDDPDLLCSIAARGGHLDCLKYAHENGAHIMESTCFEAVMGGFVECLKYAYENIHDVWLRDDILDFRQNLCYAAAEHGHLDCLKFIHENGRTCLNVYNLDLCSVAMYNGRFEFLKHVHEKGSPVTWKSCMSLIACLARESDPSREFALDSTDGRDPQEKVDDLMKCLKYVVKYEANVIEWDPGCMVDYTHFKSTSVYPWLVDAYVGNMVDDMFCRVIRETEVLKRERAAVVIQRRWLDRIYTPGARSIVLKRLADDFASRF